MKKLKPLYLILTGVALAGFAWTFDARATEGTAAPNPAGTWKWKFETQNGQTIESSLKLKVEDGKLTGTYTGRGGTEVPIRNGKIKDDEISFTVVRERNGQTMTSQY